LGAENPGASVGTTKPRIPLGSSPVWAHTTATSATEPLVIHILVPLSTQTSPPRRARVRIPAGVDPQSGPVVPEHAPSSPAAIPRSQACFCSSLPSFQSAYMASEPCTDTILRTPESPASSSRQARP